MRFPGSKLLHEWDLAVQPLSFEDLVRSCQQAGLTGLKGGAGLIFYYLGGEVNAHYRDASAAYT